LSSFEPGQVIKAVPHTSCEVVDLCDDGTKVDSLIELLLRFRQFATCSLQAFTQSFCARLKIGELDGSHFVGIHEPLETALMGTHDARRIVAALL
jgi:hypothetical protein